MAAFRPVAVLFVIGHVVVIAVILVSFIVPAGLGVALFALAGVLDIATPYFSIGQQAVLPQLSTSKFPERFALFTMNVLGESVVGVIVGLSELQDRSALEAIGMLAGVLGLANGFGLWRIYFDFVARRAPRPAVLTALLWVYLQLATLTGTTATGRGVSVADTETGSLTDPSRYLLVGASS